MATAYSQPRQYSGYLEEYNKEFLAAAMGAKQGAYNIGRAQAQEAYNKFSNVDLLKDEDKAYFKDNLYQLNEQVKMAGMGDLSQAGVVDNLTSYYSKAMDENVLNAYAGTKTIRKIQAEAEASKKDGKYSDLNYSYSMEAANKWASDGKVGSKYEGNSTYVPYTDKQAKIIEIFKEHKPDIKVTMDYSGVQHFVYKSEVLSAEKVQDILDGLVYANPEIAQQMKVDAWGQFQGLSDDSVSEILKGSVVTKREKVQKQIDSGRYKGEDLQYLNDLKDSLTADINEWDTQYKKNPTAYKEFYYKQNFSQSIKDIYVKNNLIDISSITDQKALENLKHANAKERIEIESKNSYLNNILTAVGDNKDISALTQAYDLAGVAMPDKFKGVYRSWNDLAANITASQLPTKTDEKELEKTVASPDPLAEFKAKKQETMAANINLLGEFAGNNPQLKLTPASTSKDVRVILKEENAKKGKERNDLLIESITKLAESLEKNEDNLERITEREKAFTKASIEGLPVGERIPFGEGGFLTLTSDGRFFREDRREAGESVKATTKDVVGNVWELAKAAGRNFLTTREVLNPLASTFKGEYGKKIRESLEKDWGKEGKSAEVDNIKTIVAEVKADPNNKAKRTELLRAVYNLDDIKAAQAPLNFSNTTTRLNEGKPFEISKDEAISLISTKAFSEDATEEVKGIYKGILTNYSSDKNSILFEKVVDITNTPDKSLIALANMALGRDIKDASSTTMKVNLEAGMLEFKSEVYAGTTGGTKIFTPVEATLALDQAVNQSPIVADLVGLELRKREEVAYNNRVARSLKDDLLDEANNVNSVNARAGFNFQKVIFNTGSDNEITLNVNFRETSGLADIFISADESDPMEVELRDKLTKEFTEYRKNVIKPQTESLSYGKDRFSDMEVAFQRFLMEYDYYNKHLKLSNAVGDNY